MKHVTQADHDRIASGQLARMGLIDAAWIEAAVEAIARVRAEGIETVRVVFADQHGVLRGKAVVAEALASVFANGLAAPSTLLLKDTSHRTAFPVWSAASGIASGPMDGAGDILLVPDPASFRPLPWSPHSAWLICDAHFRTGAPIGFAPREVLRRATGLLADRGMELVVGLEVEFHVFHLDDPRLGHADTTMPARAPETRALAHGYQFLTETLYDRLEPVMDRLRRAAAELGLPLRSMEVEMGPSQFEFTFDPASPMAHADNMVMFRTLVKEVCAREGLHATFMCRPKVENAAASGWHIHQSLVDAKGRNLFMPEADGALTPVAGQWIAGLLAHARESCLITTPTVNGYKRYQPFQLAPDRIQWGEDNRGAMIRALMKPGDAASRIENRVPEPAANPYYLFAAQIAAGLSGIAQGLTPPAKVETPYDAEAERLPASLLDAITAFEGSQMFRDAFGEEFVSYLSRIKRAEWDRYVAALSEWEQAEYFSLF